MPGLICSCCGPKSVMCSICLGRTADRSHESAPQIAQRYYYCAIRHGHMGVRVGAYVRVCMCSVCVCVCSHLMCTYYYYYYIIGVRRCCDGAAAATDRPFGSRHTKQIAIDLFAGAPDTMRSRSRGRGRERIALLWVMVVVVVIKNSHCGLMAL